MDYAWLWVSLLLLGFLVGLSKWDQVDKSRAKRAFRQVVPRDMGAILQGLAVMAAVGAALVAAGLVAEIYSPTPFYVGAALLAIVAVLALCVVGVGVAERYRELGFRSDLTGIIQQGRDLWSQVIASEGVLPPDKRVKEWQDDALVVLNKMDETGGGLAQRFDITAGLEATDPRLNDPLHRPELGPHMPGGIKARTVLFRLVRLGEFVRESQR